MKKLIAVILVLAVLLPAVPSLALEDSDFVGTWVNVIGDDTKFISVIVLTSDYQCYFGTITIKEDGSMGFSRTHVGTWYTKMTVNGTRIHMGTGDNTSMVAKKYGDFLAIVDDYTEKTVLDYYGKVMERFW